MKFVPAPPRVMMPAEWLVCFIGRDVHRWIDRFLEPGFRHVFMLGYVGPADVWLLYDVRFNVTEVAVVSREMADELLTLADAEGAVLRMAAASGPVEPSLLLRFGFWCTRAVVHVLGLRCVAMTPRGLHDFLLTAGAERLGRKADVELRTIGGGSGCGTAPAAAD